MIDKLAMIAMLILYISVGLIALFTYLIIRGESINKTDEEIQNDIDDEIKYLNELEEKRSKRRKFGRKNN